MEFYWTGTQSQNISIHKEGRHKRESQKKEQDFRNGKSQAHTIKARMFNTFKEIRKKNDI